MTEAGEQLENAFNLFNQFSEKLSDSYHDLEAKISCLSQELAKERSKRLVELAEKEVLAKRLENLFDALPVGVVVIDSADGITQTNRVAQEMLAVNNKHWKNTATETFESIGSELRLKDGRWVSLSTNQLNEDAEKIIVISDVSETHTLNEMLSRQQRLSSLGEMIASLAHQIRTPLSSALLNISNSNHPANNEERRLQFTEKAKERLHHLEHMVDDMLVFARGDVSEAEYIDANIFCQSIKTQFSNNEKVQNVSLLIEGDLSNVTIKANYDVLQSALQNIIDNAIDACNSKTDNLTNQNKKIIISVGLNPENYFEINIQDNGCGMTEQTTQRILEPFFTTRTNGTGLGLAVVNATVDRFNGKMTISSELGIGTNFNIKFPCVEKNALLYSGLTTNDIFSQENATLNSLNMQNKLMQENIIEASL